MTSTFGAPGTARRGRGHAGLDASTVRPITPGNPVPGLYSFSAIWPHLIRIDPCRSTSRLSGHGASPLRDDSVATWTLGRGLRLPWGAYTGVELLDTVEVLSHERYDALLSRAGVLLEGLVE